MSEESKKDVPANAPMMTVRSSRFGDLTVPVETIIELPSGVIGFPRANKFIMIDHKPPFSWLHSVEDPNLAFVVMDGFLFREQFPMEPPFGDKDSGLKDGDEYAILVVVTVRADPRTTTANVKAPIFVNIRNRKGVQVIYDDARYSTRHPLWVAQDETAAKAEAEKK